MIENIDKAIVENILHQQIIGHLGCHAFDTTYVVPISYAYANNCIYAHSSEGMKLEMMRENPAVCFEVFRMENIANWQCVICWGKYEEITDENERAETINIFYSSEKFPL